MVEFSFIILPAAWYLFVIPTWQNGIVGGILDNQFSLLTLLDYLQHNLISTLPELLLNYAALPFFLAGFYFLIRKKLLQDIQVRMFAVLGIVILFYFFFEINMIAKIHDYYLFPFYPLLFLLVAYGAYRMFRSGNRAIRYFTIVLLIILPFTAYLRMKDRWNPESPGFNKDLLVYRENLRTAVPDTARCVVGNDISHYIFFYYIHKKGWGFDNDNLGAKELATMIGQGARYLYCDSRKVDENPNILKFLDEKLLERGSVRVYSLKEP